MQICPGTVAHAGLSPKAHSCTHSVYPGSLRLPRNLRFDQKNVIIHTWRFVFVAYTTHYNNSIPNRQKTHRPWTNKYPKIIIQQKYANIVVFVQNFKNSTTKLILYSFLMVFISYITCLRGVI